MGRRSVGSGRVVYRTALALVAAGAVLPVAAQGASTKQTLTWDTVVGPSGGEACKVIGDLYRPGGVSAADPAPAVLLTHGFGGSKDNNRLIGAELADRGYVVLSYSSLGFGGSGCAIHMNEPDYDGKVASQLVDALAGTKAATDGTKIDVVRQDAKGPIVGMMGGSYGGGAQFAAVAADQQRFGSSRIRAIVPQQTWNDLNYALQPNNAGLLEGSVVAPTSGVLKQSWVALLSSLGAAISAANQLPNAGCGFTLDFCREMTTSSGAGSISASLAATLRRASVSDFVSRIRVPTMLMQGRQDSLFNLNQSLATYYQLRRQDTPTKLVWVSAGHSGGPAPGEATTSGFGPTQTDSLLKADGTPTVNGRMIFEWFDHYLRNDPKTPSLDFSYFRTWTTYDGLRAETAYARAPEYPAAPATRLLLSDSHALVGADEQAQPGISSFTTLPAGGSPSSGESQPIDPGLPPSDPPGSAATWTTKPLAADTDVVGAAVLNASIDAPPGTAVFAKLYDRAPDGSVALAGKLVAAARLTASGPTRITLPGIVYRFPVGHSISLVLSSSDAAYRARSGSGTVTVATSATQPGTLDLPIVASARQEPVIHAGAPRTSVRAPKKARTGRSFRISWTGTDEGGAGLRTYQLQWRRTGKAWRTYPGLRNTTKQRLRLRVRTRRTVQFRVRATNAGGTRSPWSRSASTQVSRRR